MSGTVTLIATNSKRLCCVLYDTGTVKILVFCVKMPSDRANDAEYEDVLINISQLFNSHDNTMVVIGGDFNISFARSTESRTKKLKDYLLHENFKCCIEHVLLSEIDYTYESKINNDVSVKIFLTLLLNIQFFIIFIIYQITVILSLDIDVDYVTMQNEVIDDDLTV